MASSFALLQYTVERLAPTLRLVRAGEKLFSISLFPKESAQEKTHRKPKQVTVSRSVAVTIKFPDDESFDSLRKTLAELRCPSQSDLKSRAISFDQQYQAKFDEAVQLVQSDFAIEVE